MNDVIDRNWYSSESLRQEREAATRMLREMKDLEKEFGKTRVRKVERTDFGVRIRYVRKSG